METLTITHNYGFFACCSLRLHDIVLFFNHRKKLPDRVDSSQQFKLFRTYEDYIHEDICRMFFKTEAFDITYEKFVDFSHPHQFINFSLFDFDSINKFIKKYFKPTKLVELNILELEQKYEIDYNNTVSVFYRGNDKCTETPIAKYEVFFKKCFEILENNPQIKFLIQTDEKEFVDQFKQKFPNSFDLEELPKINKNIEMVMHKAVDPIHKPKFALDFLSATIIVSKCKYLVTHTGNCGMWACLFRGNTNNVFQYDHTKDSFWEH